MLSTDTAIIGAGPYGISLAAHLSAAGVPHQVLGQPMAAWRHFMPPGMLLRSEAFASNLDAPQRGFTVEAYCRKHGIRYEPLGMALPLETFVDYALWFQANLVDTIRTVDVVNLRQADGHFQLALGNGDTLLARTVVIALGLKGFAQTPPVLQGLPEHLVSHSEIYGDLTWAHGKDIVIVGGGQSAFGLAALLHELGSRVHVLVRDAGVIWHERPNAARNILLKLLHPDAGLGRGWRSQVLSECPNLFHLLDHRSRHQLLSHSHGPSGAWWLHDRVVGKVKISFLTEILDAVADRDQVILRTISNSKESYIAADHVIAATGFKVDMRRHAFLSKDIMDSISVNDGLPELTANFETRVRGLYVIGPATAHSFGPVMRFVHGTKHAAPRVARHIAKTLRTAAKEGARLPADSRIMKETEQ